MSMVPPRSGPRRHRIAWTILWLGPVVLAWAGLMVLARRPTPRAIAMTRILFGVLIALSYAAFWVWAIGVSRTPRLTLFRGLALSMSLAGMIVCLELPAALGLVHWPIVFRALSGEGNDSSTDFRFDSQRGFRRPPHGHWSGRPTGDIEQEWTMPPSLREPIRFTYDSLGYRNPTALERADVALIGDSFVEGWYVSDDQTAARVLQARLGRLVANLGVSGYGPMQELVVLQQDGVRLEPRVVVWFFFEGNDLTDDERFQYTLAETSDPPPRPSIGRRVTTWAHAWQRQSFTVTALRQLRRWSEPILPNRVPYFGRLAVAGGGRRDVYFTAYAAAPWSDYEADLWKRTRGAFEQGAALCRARGIHLLICYIPIKFRVYRPFVELPPGSPCRTWEVGPLPGLFADFCRSADIPFLDLTGLLQESVRRGGMPYAVADSHWSPEGHTLVANRLAGELRRRGWLTPGEAGTTDPGLMNRRP